MAASSKRDISIILSQHPFQELFEFCIKNHPMNADQRREARVLLDSALNLCKQCGIEAEDSLFYQIQTKGERILDRIVALEIEKARKKVEKQTLKKNKKRKNRDNVKWLFEIGGLVYKINKIDDQISTLRTQKYTEEIQPTLSEEEAENLVQWLHVNFVADAPPAPHIQIKQRVPEPTQPNFTIPPYEKTKDNLKVWLIENAEVFGIEELVKPYMNKIYIVLRVSTTYGISLTKEQITLNLFFQKASEICRESSTTSY